MASVRRRLEPDPFGQQVEEARDRGVRRDRGGRVLPARSNLVAVEWRPAPVEAAEARPGGDRLAEVTARATAGGGAVTDPATGRLGLGRLTVGAPPRDHGT